MGLTQYIRIGRANLLSTVGLTAWVHGLLREMFCPLQRGTASPFARVSVSTLQQLFSLCSWARKAFLQVHQPDPTPIFHSPRPVKLCVCLLPSLPITLSPVLGGLSNEASSNFCGRLTHNLEQLCDPNDPKHNEHVVIRLSLQ